MANTEKWENYIGMMIGVAILGVSGYLFFEADTTMRMVEAGGIVSQAVAESEYTRAADFYLYSGVGIVAGHPSLAKRRTAVQQ